MAEFTFGQVEAVLADVNWVAAHKRVAFAGRLKFLQKNGVPARRAPGRGKAGAYSFSQMLQLAFGLEFLQCGLTPQRAADLVKVNWPWKTDEIFSILVECEERQGRPREHPIEDAERWVWILHPEELRELADGETPNESRLLDAVSTRALNYLSLYDRGRGLRASYRTLVINPVLLVEAIIASIQSHGFGTLSDLIAEMEAPEFKLRDSAAEFCSRIENGIADICADEARRSSWQDYLATIADGGDLSKAEWRHVVRMTNYAMSPVADWAMIDVVRFCDRGQPIVVSENNADSSGFEHLAELHLLRPEGEGVYLVTPLGALYLEAMLFGRLDDVGS